MNYATLDNPGPLIIELDRNILGSQKPIMWLKKPGKTAKILGCVIVGETDHATMLETLAGAMRRAKEMESE